MELTEKIEIQRKKIETGNPAIRLVDSCRLDNGIQQLSSTDIQKSAKLFDEAKHDLDVCFFVPASGSGSRMFKLFFDYLENSKQGESGNSNDDAGEMISKIQQLGIANLLNADTAQLLAEGDEKYAEVIIRSFIDKRQLNLSECPKGLIPFHIYDHEILNPFQEHLVHSKAVGTKKSRIHFTISKAFESEIKDKINELDFEMDVSFSEQDPQTNSIAFTADLQPASDNGQLIMRPAGHGALINNLNSIDSDLVFIRNIDNLQHQSKAAISVDTRKALGNELLTFKKDIDNVLSKLSKDQAFESSLKTLNDAFDLKLSDQELKSPTAAFEALNRPIRICGMVKNEGEPGGGPFWVEGDDKKISRQIIEKSQISNDPNQLKLVETATHFNPVELVCSVKDFKGNKFNLMDFVNEDHYFIVNKTQGGQDIQYIEQPGLWNGAMANWLTLFYEIDARCFSPVKSVFDLLKDAHRG